MIKQNKLSIKLLKMDIGLLTVLVYMGIKEKLEEGLRGLLMKILSKERICLLLPRSGIHSIDLNMLR